MMVCRLTVQYFSVECQFVFRLLLFVPRRLVDLPCRQLGTLPDGWSTALGNTTVYVGVTIFAKRLDFFRFHVVRTETCLTLLCRVHRYLLKSAITVCLMGHTAVQTSVAQRVCFHLSRATQSATLSSAGSSRHTFPEPHEVRRLHPQEIVRRMMCCQAARPSSKRLLSA